MLMRIDGDTAFTCIIFDIIQFILFSVARIYTVYPTRALSFIWMIFMFRNIRKTNRV